MLFIKSISFVSVSSNKRVFIESISCCIVTGGRVLSRWPFAILHQSHIVYNFSKFRGICFVIYSKVGSSQSLKLNNLKLEYSYFAQKVFVLYTMTCVLQHYVAVISTQVLSRRSLIGSKYFSSIS